MSTLRPCTAWILALITPAGLAAAPASPWSAFEPAATTDSATNTYLLAVASALMYPSRSAEEPGASPEERQQSAYRRLGLEVVAALEGSRTVDDVPALLLASKETLVVVFRGSETSSLDSFVRDWLQTDARAKLVPYLDGSVHRGFSEALDGIYPDLLGSVHSQLTRRRRLWLTGHSLGGALATLAAQRLMLDGVSVHGLVTFAAPRVGDAPWAEGFVALLGERSQQWVHDRDPVPRLPPSSRERPYVNVGVVNLVGPGHAPERNAAMVGAGVPHPKAHRMGVYEFLLHSELPAKEAAMLPEPDPVCPIAYRVAGRHPEDGHALCHRRFSRPIAADRCRERGGEVLDTWCAMPVAGRDRYHLRELENPGAP